ncbi:MAG: TonB-dependent receptor [Bacteroides sp.]
MKKPLCQALLAAMLLHGTAHAIETPADTIKVVDVEEIVIIATPKENKKLRELPTSVTLLSQQQMQEAQVTGIKSLTAMVPNLFIPDYGSRLTSAIYIRGIGSRINTPSVGLYVDNIPYVNQSAFDFGYADVERIDVLRGPQSTLYGRNAMGGLIKVHTKSPMSYQGTDLRLGAATHNEYHASLTHYHRVSPHFAFSTGGYYDYQGGFFRNATLGGKRVDDGQRAGGRFRGILLPSDQWKVDLSLSYEYNDQGGYPYYHEESITSNEAGSYRRNLLNAGLNLQYKAKEYTLSAVTGYQWLEDRMFIDQDFTAAPIYTLEQRQRIHTVSEEVVLKSNPGKRWQWTTGAFGFYQSLHTNGPVNFLRQGIEQMIEGSANQVFDRLAAENPKMPSMSLSVNNEQLGVSGRFRTPTLSGALFHQSTFNDLFTEGLSLTLGLRLDYEKLKMEYLSAADPTDIGFAVKMGPMSITNKNPMVAEATYDGTLTTDYLQLLPKAALQYEWKKGNSVYASVARGYRSGGYNIQMFSDLVSGKLSNAMMDAIAADENFKRFGEMIKGMQKELPEVKEATSYKPEYSWNYEVGSHLTLWDGRLTADLSAYLMETRDQQIARFAESGLGRITVNAGRSRSLGGEAALQAALTDALTLQTSYGYTYATFRDYVTNDRQQNEVDYRGRYVPFVPKHTLSIGGAYRWHIKQQGAWIDRVVLNAHYQAAGRIYWTEENNASQSIYGTLNGRLSLQKGNGQIDFWVRNALNKDYTAFYFESMGNAFHQKGRPIQAGVEIRCRF